MFDFYYWQAMLSQFHFLRPHWLWLLLVLVVIVVLRSKQHDTKALNKYFSTHLREALIVGENDWRQNLPFKVLMILLTLAIVVCSGPTWQRESSPFGEDNADLVVVLDSNQTMLEEDIAPNRLQRAKYKIQDLLNLREGGKTALITYAGSAHLVMPLTQDERVLLPFLNAISLDIMPVKGKATEQTLPLILQQLENSVGATVLLITDGIEPSSIDAYSDFFQRHDHQLLVLAMGDPQDRSHHPVDLASLKKLTKQTNGKLITTTVDSEDVNRIVNYIDRNMHVHGDQSTNWQDMGYNLIILIALIQLCWFRKGWLVKWCVVGSVMTSLAYTPIAQASEVTSGENNHFNRVSITEQIQQTWWDLWLTSEQQGQRWFNKKQYLKAAVAFQDPMRKGIAYYYSAEYELAYHYFMQTKNGKGYLYAANALARQREYLAGLQLLKKLQQQPLSSELMLSVENNYEVLNSIVDEINRVSASQSGTTDGLEESFELGDNPQTADGAEEMSDSELMLSETLNENEILGSNELADKWLQKVSADPKYFLQAKFNRQWLESRTSINDVGETYAY